MRLTIPDLAALKALPLQALAQTPAEAPPPGVMPNFTDPPINVPLILGLLYFFFAVASTCFMLRVWMKTSIVKRWQWDDCKSSGKLIVVAKLIAF
jgi:hypothetical protein